MHHRFDTKINHELDHSRPGVSLDHTRYGVPISSEKCSVISDRKFKYDKRALYFDATNGTVESFLFLLPACISDHDESLPRVYTRGAT